MSTTPQRPSPPCFSLAVLGAAAISLASVTGCGGSESASPADPDSGGSTAQGGGGHGGAAGAGASGGDAPGDPFGHPTDFDCSAPYPEQPSINLPADEAPHQDYFEWWYWTGHLVTADGRRFGFQLTFFEAWPYELGGLVSGTMGHFAITDVDGEQYAHESHFAAMGSYAHTSEGFDLSIATSTATGLGEEQHLTAAMAGYELDLALTDLKRPALHYGNGTWAYPEPYTGANNYYSRSRMSVTGTLVAHGEPLSVEGVAWMDQQWGAPVLEAGAAVDDYHWDWMQLQLATGEELMLYTVYLHGAPWTTGGTWVGADCGTEQLSEQEIEIDELGQWQSPHTGTTYPSGWEVRLPSRGLTLTVAPVLVDQEFHKHGDNALLSAIVPPSYWEGAVDVAGSGPDGSVTGLGYVEVIR